MAVYRPPAPRTVRVVFDGIEAAGGGSSTGRRCKAVDLAAVFCWWRDCGDQLLLSALNETTSTQAYHQAMDMLVTLQAVAVPEDALPH